MKKKTLVLGWLVVIILIVLLIGTTIFFKVYREIPKVEMEQLKDYQDTYLGDNVKVRELVGLLPYADKVRGIELVTSQHPYRLIIDYQMQKEKEELMYSSLLLYSLISNVEEIEYQMIKDSVIITKEDGRQIISNYTIEEAQQYVKKKYIQSQEQEYNMTINQKGKPVFVDNNKALQQMNKDFQKAITQIQKEFKLFPFSFFNYKSYKIYGWQLTIGNEEEKKQAKQLTSLIDIYENSYE